MNRLTTLCLLMFAPSAIAEPLPKAKVNCEMPLRDGMKLVYSYQVTGLDGNSGLEDATVETRKLKSNEDGTYFAVESPGNAGDKDEKIYLLAKDRKVFQIYNGRRYEILPVFKMKVGTEFKKPVLFSKAMADFQAKIEGEEELEVLGKKYQTTRFSSQYVPNGKVFKSTYWMTDGDGPGIVKQVSEQLGITFTLTLKEYTPGK